MDKATVTNVIYSLKKSLTSHGIADSNIALFGSALTGNMHEDSDIDLIIISKDFEGKDIFERAKMTVQPEEEVIRKYRVPMDILTMSPEEYEEARTTFYNAEIII
jgi:predicted nucleotidyltransferase